MQLSVRVERGEERVLERRVLGRLLQVAVHLACRREDALDASGGGGRSTTFTQTHVLWNAPCSHSSNRDKLTFFRGTVDLARFAS